MFASEIYGPGRIRLIDVPEPDPMDGPGQILFQPEMGCLCGSDVPFFLREPLYDPQPGHSLHEVVGRIIESNGTRHREGELAMSKIPGHTGVRERIWMKEDEANPLPKTLKIEEGVLSQPLGTVIHAARKLPNLVDKRVAIVGQGPMGQLFTSTIRSLGARSIICIDPVAARLEVSELMGATDVINPQELDPVDAVKQLTGGSGADLVIEAVGHHDLALNQCIQMCRPEGRILQFGVPLRGSISIQLDDLFRKNITLITSVDPYPDPDYGLAMSWIGEGRIDVGPLVTHHFPITEIQTAYDTFSGRKDGAIKVFLDFPNRGSE